MNAELPEAFQDRMRQLLGSDAELLLAALTSEPVTGLRANTLKVAPERLRSLLPWQLAPVPWSPTGFLVEGGASPGRHPFHAAGLYYLQDPSAMAVAEALAPQPGDRVLDLAAAPGGKSTQLASLMRDEGLLVANELNRPRAKALLENLERWGVKNALVTSEAVSRLAERWGAIFDKVLLDAPCSGEGMFRKSEDARHHWSEANVRACALRQIDLLADAARLVAPGGLLVYSTCTFAPEENEQVVAEFLTGHPGFALEPLGLPGASPGLAGFGLDAGALTRFWPHLSPGEGHFVASLRRRDGEPERLRLHRAREANRDAVNLWRSFARATLPVDPAAGKTLAVFGQQLYALPDELPELSGLHALRAGLWLGTLKTKRLEPAHALALALSPAEAEGMNRLELSPSGPEAQAYLRGEPLEAGGPDGWLLVTVSGFPLGWGKRSQGVINNAYPRGLRWL